MAKDLYIVIGAGGTGGYFIDNLLQYLTGVSSKKEHDIIAVDGDIVEERNLLRQGFFNSDLHKNKAEAIVNRLASGCTERVSLTHRNMFINNVQDVIDLVPTDSRYDTVYLISCVDNNMARLRLNFATYAIRDKFRTETIFLDSGNSEWTGQTLALVLKKSGTAYLDGLYAEVEKALTSDFKLNLDNIQSVLDYNMQDTTNNHYYSSIFSNMEDWTNNLNKADFEQSCEDVVVSSPQNISTNMMASSVLLLRLATIHRNEFESGEIRFNSETITTTLEDEGTFQEENFQPRLLELLNYIKTPLGFMEIFTSEIIVDNEHDIPNTFDELRLPPVTNTVTDTREMMVDEIVEDFDIEDSPSEVPTVENEDVPEIELPDEEPVFGDSIEPFEEHEPNTTEETNETDNMFGDDWLDSVVGTLDEPTPEPNENNEEENNVENDWSWLDDVITSSEEVTESLTPEDLDAIFNELLDMSDLDDFNLE